MVTDSQGLASLFDPIGMLTPVTIKVELLFKEIRLSKVDWDDELANVFADYWSQIKKKIRKR